MFLNSENIMYIAATTEKTWGWEVILNLIEFGDDWSSIPTRGRRPR